MFDKKDLENKITELEKAGFNLYLSVYKLDENGKRQLKASKVKIDNLPNFTVDYQDWYTKCCRLIETVAPYRLKDFTDLYKIQNRKTLTFDNYCICDALLGTSLTRGITVVAKPIDVAAKVKMQSDIVGSLKGLIGDYFYNLETELEYNVFDSELESAYELLKKKFLRSAGVIAGVVLEKHLAKICKNHGLNIKKKDPSISDYNDTIKPLIKIAEWRKIQYLGDLRNLCCHNKDVEPTYSQVSELLDGTKNVISTIF